MAAIIISKSKYLAGLQCPKLLWYWFNAKDQIPSPDEAQQAIFDQGHEVGNWAKKLFPNGIEIERNNKMIDKTMEAVKQRKPIFEATFSWKNAYSQIDILNPVGNDEWDMIEVKSSTEVKDINIQDVSFQKYCVAGKGLKVRKCFLMFVNNEYVRKGKIEPEKLLKKEEITTKVDELLPEVEKNINKMIEIIKGKCPDIAIGKQCSDPYDCCLTDMCWSFLPKNNVAELYRIGAKKFELIDQGILEIKDVPSSVKITDKQQIQIDALKSKKPIIDKENIKMFFKKLKYPIYCLDFESFNTAVPMFDNVKPYQQIPFQFSIHVIEKDGKIKHFEFLGDGNKDPRAKLLSALKVIKKKGTVLAYNMSFEKGILKNLSEQFPKKSKWINQVIDRIDDLLIPFRNFWFYHPEQHGSCSIKYVLPALTGKTYEGMEVSKGDQASREYLRINFTKVSKEEKAKVRKALLEYCKQDTLGMVEVMRKLGEVVE